MKNPNDWLNRDFDLPVSEHDLIGEVFMVSAPFPSTLATNTKEFLLKRGEKWSSWSRGRVIFIKREVVTEGYISFP